MGLHRKVRHLLDNMTIGDLAKLIYRDDITIKHASRKRLQDEIDQKTHTMDAKLPKHGPEHLSILGTDNAKYDPLSKMLIQYMLEALTCDIDGMFFISTIHASLIRAKIYIYNIDRFY